MYATNKKITKKIAKAIIPKTPTLPPDRYSLLLPEEPPNEVLPDPWQNKHVCLPLPPQDMQVWPPGVFEAPNLLPLPPQLIQVVLPLPPHVGQKSVIELTPLINSSMFYYYTTY